MIKTDKLVSQHEPVNPDPQMKGVSLDGITHPQEQQTLPDRLPQSLIEWLARINRRYLALERSNPNRQERGFNIILLTDSTNDNESLLTEPLENATRIGDEEGNWVDVRAFSDLIE